MADLNVALKFKFVISWFFNLMFVVDFKMIQVDETTSSVSGQFD